jgi:hypothetical protein
MYATLITPFNVAFHESTSTAWIVVDTLVDIGFFADLLLEFFTAYYDEDDSLICDKKVIH